MKDENQAATSEVANELNSKCQAATNEQQTHGVVGSLDTRWVVGVVGVVGVIVKIIKLYDHQ
jgi:hypothetical protein